MLNTQNLILVIHLILRNGIYASYQIQKMRGTGAGET